MGYRDIHEAIVNKLGTITQIKVVYNHAPTVLSGYPAAIAIPARNENIIFTNQDNLREYIFYIEIILEFKTVPLAQAIYNLEDLLDIVIQEFETDFQLSGVVDFTMGLNGAIDYTTGAQGNFVYGQLEWRGKKEVSVQ